MAPEKKTAQPRSLLMYQLQLITRWSRPQPPEQDQSPHVLQKHITAPTIKPVAAMEGTRIQADARHGWQTRVTSN
jgi:hypothetical protein